MAASGESGPPQQAVRFSSRNEEIEPPGRLQQPRAAPAGPGDVSKSELSRDAHEQLRSLAQTLDPSRIQSRRMENFSYEPVSLPVSRVPSPSSGTQTPASHATYSAAPSPRHSPPISALQSPPLTPHGSRSREHKHGLGHGRDAKPQLPDPAMVTPQVSPPQQEPRPSMEGVCGERNAASLPPSRLPTSQTQARPKSMDMAALHGPPKQAPDSGAPSGRPFTPDGDRNDPYARSKRPPQPRNLDSLEARFIFGSRGSRSSSGQAAASASGSGSGSGSGTAAGTADSKASDRKRHSFFGHDRKHDKPSHEDNGRSEAHAGLAKQHGSMSELKRFFKLGGHRHRDKRSQSPARSAKSAKSGIRTPPSQTGSIGVPFADDHGLQSKYGKFGKVLGSGAGGSVRLMKRSSDGVTFAVKQFRARHSYESEREYSKKVTAEFCVGSTLHHGNIIETMDLVHEKGNWYVVMEYAPFDLFAIVMTGKMTREEIGCCTLQILAGVTYLHGMGLAHRDLKLDNVVVNEHGIMKIIDFGSAAVFRYPFENELVLASGIVGSDPYLAPEVYDLARYDPQPTDIWSLAIIFCCMTLRRFPWKAPRLSDNSYRLFVSPPNDGPGVRSTNSPRGSAADVAEPSGRRHKGSYSEPASRQPSDASPAAGKGQQNGSRSDPATNEGSRPPTAAANGQSPREPPQPQPQQVIKGPWRLLRLLPRESRHIVGRMLEVDPKKRATMEEILADRWVSTAAVCRQEEGSVIVRAGNHTHVLEPGTGVEATPSKK